MAHIPRALRQQVIERAKGHCEYCQAPQLIIVEMEIDHIIPKSAGGETTSDNLCLACRGCNGRKGSFQKGIDPENGTEVDLFNPRTQVWAEHFMWSGDFTHVIGLTPTGRATIVRLRMNRADVVKARPRWLRAGWNPPIE